ncbi:MAG TPA: hydrogenase maturation nickel metallochaperone HypA [Candidatus Methylomirabilis sp.]|nr:hydrogenase maturation nickel metallochaperone HypA [Candidatus Methylomirabilis sp.]
MHEYSLAQALVEQVEREARARGALTVHRVTVRIGPLSGVEPDLLVTAYGHLRAGTLCAGAELDVAGERVAWCCEACGVALVPGSALCCPDCGLPARLAGGDALVLERIELEVPAHV